MQINHKIKRTAFRSVNTMTISLYKHKSYLNEDGSIVSTCNISPETNEKIIEALGNEPAIFPLKFTFCLVNKFDGIMAQLLILRNVKRCNVIVREDFILLVKKQNE